MFGITVFRPYRAEPAPNPIQGRCPWLYGSCPVGAKRKNKMPPQGKRAASESGAPGGGLSGCTMQEFGNFVFPKLQDERLSVGTLVHGFSQKGKLGVSAAKPNNSAAGYWF